VSCEGGTNFPVCEGCSLYLVRVMRRIGVIYGPNLYLFYGNRWTERRRNGNCRLAARA
jgi:hypothetical protein